MTVSNALFTEREVIKETNSALEDIQETLALSLVDSLKDGDHITTPTVIDMLKDLEDMQLKYYDRLEDNENTQGGLANQEKPFYEDDKDETPDEDKDEIAEGWKKFEKEQLMMQVYTPLSRTGNQLFYPEGTTLISQLMVW
ncbi:hypothetical protein [Leuconostoc pseudomesenteroides]|uniref:hypothetical protein n=1 Tax=Leuconostoc pseudomesenteroides TaxID=33968 RepID=UPI0039E89FC8